MRMTMEERRLIDDALAAGCVRRVAPRPQVRPVANDDVQPPVEVTAARRAPPDRPPAVPARLSVRGALEWAFAVEHARMDYDEIEASSGAAQRGRSVEAVIAERAMLGPVSIDTSPGRSDPADEADLIASALRAALSWRDACWMAELARARRAPDLLDNMAPRLLPVEWVQGRGGSRGRVADVLSPGVAASLDLPPRGGWPVGTGLRRNRKGAVVRDPVSVTPCRWSPSADQVAAARRAWLDWWGHLLTVRSVLGARVGRIEITDEMPPLSPWRKGA